MRFFGRAHDTQDNVRSVTAGTRPERQIKSWPRYARRGILAAVLLMAAVAAPWLMYWLEQTRLTAGIEAAMAKTRGTPDGGLDPEAGFGYFEDKTVAPLPGITEPRFERAGQSGLADQEWVIGVRVGRIYRAYPIKNMSQLKTHVINDLIDGTPVTITYCDWVDKARVLTDPDCDSPLDVAIGGWDVQGLQLSLVIQGTPYLQSSSEVPLRDHPFELMTWGQWRRAHPATDILVVTPK